MSQETKTHWKKLTNPDYIGSYALDPGEERSVTILSVARETVTGADGKKEECTVAKLEGNKPFILNSTNQKLITKALGSPYIEDWRGRSITIYSAKVRAFGETVEALRVKDKAPVETKPELTPSHKRWAGAVLALKQGNTTLEDIKSVFIISQENEKELCKISESEPAQ